MAEARFRQSFTMCPAMPQNRHRLLAILRWRSSAVSFLSVPTPGMEQAGVGCKVGVLVAVLGDALRCAETNEWFGLGMGPLGGIIGRSLALRSQ
jgi:hypothetical protein